MATVMQMRRDLGRVNWWMCLNPYFEGTKPQVRHASREEAEAEAERLCVKTGRKIHVLQVVSTVHPARPYLEVRD
jgi:hypothetical protein